MDTSTLSRNDWIVVAGMALMFIAMLVSDFHTATLIAWLLTLLASLVAVVKAVPGATLELPISLGVLIMALGFVALVIVLFSPGRGCDSRLRCRRTRGLRGLPQERGDLLRFRRLRPADVPARRREP